MLIRSTHTHTHPPPCSHQVLDLRSVYQLHNNFRILQQRLATICPNATEEQITEFADVCPVCREAMTVGTARILPCRHILHGVRVVYYCICCIALQQPLLICCIALQQPLLILLFFGWLDLRVGMPSPMAASTTILSSVSHSIAAGPSAGHTKQCPDQFSWYGCFCHPSALLLTH